MRPPSDSPRPVSDRDSDVQVDPTVADVGSEGGSAGDVELVKNPGRGAGSEAGETWRPVDEVETTTRDETGVGRRSP
jgi:hypothetical protein